MLLHFRQAGLEDLMHVYYGKNRLLNYDSLVDMACTDMQHSVTCCAGVVEYFEQWAHQ